MTPTPIPPALAAHLQADGLLAYPTEGVWGLGCDPHNPEALQRLIDLKGRDSAKGLILVAASLAQIQPLLQGLSAAQRARLEQDWPGFVTYLLPLPQPSPYPALLTGHHGRIAVRVSAHP
ncbi:MAG TPA: Sua5/YciO/YrdC/YwlC family protein, partial [Myxococcota bacterium]|nr:Sua5/YciO/YrdC/YwlC family protein [Myxococcota bacterium]